MTHDQVKKLIGKKVKVYFKEHDTRLPMIGKFVELEDSKELEVKRMVRFVSLSKEDNYESAVQMRKIEFTRLFKVNDFHSTKEVLDVTSDFNTAVRNG